MKQAESKGLGLQEKTRAAAAPRKPKNGAVSSPLNTEDISSLIGLREFGKLIGN